MIRRPYRTKCRFLRDSELECTVHWYIVPATNPTLGFPCRINSLDWRDNRQNPSPVGEVSFEDRPFDGWGRIIPPVPGDELCGTRDDFENGGRYLPDLPPFPRAADGVALCCRPEVGGIMLGGETIFPSPLAAGGLVLSGETITDPEVTYYSVTSTMPETGFNPETQVPASVATFWRQGTQARLYSGAPRGTASDWRLFLDAEGFTGEFTRVGWDGLGSDGTVWTLVTGDWPGEVRVSEGI